MSLLPQDPQRRAFLGDALKLGAGSLLIGAAMNPAARAADLPISGAARGPVPDSRLPELPERVLVDHDGSGLGSAQRQGTRFTTAQGAVELVEGPAGLAVRVTCPTGLLNRVVLRWAMTFPAGALFLGDHWERGYGDLQWRFLQPERVMPWYFAAHDVASGHTFMAGVKTQPAALCFWTVDAAGISLWLDFRNGGSPCRPGDREIAAATVVSLATTKEETPFAALSRFCRVLAGGDRR